MFRAVEETISINGTRVADLYICTHVGDKYDGVVCTLELSLQLMPGLVPA